MDTTASPSQLDAPQSAKSVGLRYVSDDKAGIRRQKTRNGFRYLDTDGVAIRDALVLSRIKSLVIPPAWQDVWICPLANGHLQVTGRDAKLRKQYHYHPRWRKVRDEAKYERMINFGKMLPELRIKIDLALQLPGLPREKALATVIRLLELTKIRVGNEEYARTNKSFGLTTLKNRHVKIEGAAVAFDFRGKSGVVHALKLHDRRMANIIKRMRDLPGQELFQYVDENGERHSIDSSDVNAYLQELTGEDYTAKDFRTWAGTMLATVALLELEQYGCDTEAKKNIDQVIKTVAKELGNTPRICRNCYVHPVVIESYLDEKKWQVWQKCMLGKTGESDAIACTEDLVLELLEQHVLALT